MTNIEEIQNKQKNITHIDIQPKASQKNNTYQNA